MLLQSHAGVLHLLPALPEAWPEGEVKGLRARGGFTVDMRWKDGKLVEARIKAGHKSGCQVRYANSLSVSFNAVSDGAPRNIVGDLDLFVKMKLDRLEEEGLKVRRDGQIMSFEAVSGLCYTLTPD